MKRKRRDNGKIVTMNLFISELIPKLRIIFASAWMKIKDDFKPKKLKLDPIPIDSKRKKKETLITILHELGVQLFCLRYNINQFKLFGDDSPFQKAMKQYNDIFEKKFGYKAYNENVNYIIPFPTLEKLNNVLMICGGFHKKENVLKGKGLNTKFIDQIVLDAILSVFEEVDVGCKIVVLQNTKKLTRIKEPNDENITHELKNEIFKIRHPKKLKQKEPRLYVAIKANTTFCNFCIPRKLNDRLRICVDKNYSCVCVCYFRKILNENSEEIKKAMLDKKVK